MLKKKIKGLRSRFVTWIHLQFHIVKQVFLQTVENRPVVVSAAILSVTALTVLLLDIVFKPSFNDLLVELHGLVYDLFIFGIVILAVDQWRSRRERITRYQEELSDYRNWHEPEASYRIAGLIKRLHRDGIKVDDLSGVYLRNADLTGLHYWGINFSNANLESVNFSGATLGDVNFTNCNLRSSNFINATIPQACFRNADLTGADLRGASTNLNDFSGATLEGANLSGLNLNGSKFSKTVFRNSILTGAAISGNTKNIDLTNADLRRGHIGNVDFSEANLDGVRLDGAYLYAIIDIAGWENIASIKNANVHKVKPQPKAARQSFSRQWACPKNVCSFYEWALTKGAVDMPWEEWIVFRKSLT